MSDLQLLYVVFAALYFTECVVWARRGAVVFTAPFFVGTASAAPPPATFGNARGAFMPLWPLPPLGSVFVVEPWPFSASPEGVVSWSSFALHPGVRAPGTPRRLRWSEVVDVRTDDRDVLVAGTRFATTSSRAHASAAAAVLARLADADEAGRAAVLDACIAEALSCDAVRERLRQHRRVARVVVAAASMCFIVAFIALPIVVMRDGLSHWPVVLAALYASVAATAATTFHASRTLQPALRGARWGQLLLALPAPGLAIRSNDKLSRHLLADAHPVAVALVLLRDAHRDDVVGALLRDLRTPRAPAVPGDDEVARAIERDFRMRVLRQAEPRARDAGVDVDVQCGPPAALGALAWWCPRCRTRYRTGGTCTDCGGLPLRDSSTTAGAS